MKYFLYILSCSDNTLYTGITTNLHRRLDEHNGLLEGGAKYTAGRRPINLVYSKEYNNRSQAGKEEWRIKKLTRIEKQKLIDNYGT